MSEQPKPGDRECREQVKQIVERLRQRALATRALHRSHKGYDANLDDQAASALLASEAERVRLEGERDAARRFANGWQEKFHALRKLREQDASRAQAAEAELVVLRTLMLAHQPQILQTTRRAEGEGFTPPSQPIQIKASSHGVMGKENTVSVDESGVRPSARTEASEVAGGRTSPLAEGKR